MVELRKEKNCYRVLFFGALAASKAIDAYEISRQKVLVKKRGRERVYLPNLLVLKVKKKKFNFSVRFKCF